MEPPGGRDTRFNLGYNMNLLSGTANESSPDVYGNPGLGRPGTSLQQLSPRHHSMVSGACNRAALKSDIYDDRALAGPGMGLDGCVGDIADDAYSMQSKKSPPSNGKKTKGRVKIKMEYIENKLRRYTTFSKRKTGIMKKAYELSTLTGTQVMLLVASETGHVYTFATRKLQPMITSEAGKALIQTCLNSPDPPAGSAGGDQRMSATGFEETELTYNISDDDSKEDDSGSESSSEEMETGEDSTQQINHNKPPSSIKNIPLSTTIPSTSSSISSSTTTPSTLPAIPSTPAIPSSTTPVASTSSSPASLSSSSSSAAAASGSSGQVQALPIVLQTPAGIGYATTTDGSILGLLQGPNIVQPQFVAIPISNVTAQKTDDVVNKINDDKTS